MNAKDIYCFERACELVKILKKPLSVCYQEAEKEWYQKNHTSGEYSDEYDYDDEIDYNA